MYIGFDIGGTNTKYGIVNEQGKILEKAAFKTNHEKIEFLSDLESIVKKMQLSYPKIKGIGISAPGIIKKNGYMVTAGAIKSLYGTNLKVEMEERCKLPTSVDNDANAAAIAEKWIGNARELENYLCIVLGTGIGGGIVINKQLYRGAHGMAGEFGWMMIDKLPDEGNLETVSLNQRAAIVGGLCFQYNKKIAELKSDTETIEDAREIFLLEEQGDELAREVVGQFLEDIAVGLVNLIAAFDPEAILIGGAISSNGEFMKRLTEKVFSVEARHESINYLNAHELIPIKPAKLKNDAGILGAVYQIHQQLG